ncbi:MAG: PEGA domain-containing protein, partial [Deltaproteobacteria bacterium]|nr:PEGA domain-containing protein [Deltaproteobacteria bacterium]
ILKGKFGYMSPEQVRGLPLDRRSDVFALGVVLYEMLTGERLFVGESDFSVLEKVRAVDILPPSTYNRRIPPALEKIVLRALAKDVEDRFSYANELGDELQRFLITNDTIFSRKDLMQFMKSTFAEDVEREKTKLAEYAEIKLPPGMAALAGGAAPAPAARPLPPPVAEQPPHESTMMLAEAPGPTSAPRAAPPGNPAPRATGIRPAITNPGVNGTRPGVPGPPVMTQGRAPMPGPPPGARNTGVGPALAPTRNSVSGPNPIRTNARMAPVAVEPSPLASLVDEDFESEATQIPQNQRSQKTRLPEADDEAPPQKSKLPLMLGVAGGVVALGLAGVVGLNVLGKAQGTLLLTCTPSENLVIIVDGQPAGSSTPLSLSLPAGDHEVSVTSKGYELQKKNFSVEAKKEVDVDVPLKKKGEATADAPKPDAPKAAAASVPAMIVLETSGAEVSLDGKVVIAKDAKDATFMGSSDATAKHVIEAKLDGYKPFSQSFDPGQPIQAKVTLQKAQ